MKLLLKNYDAGSYLTNKVHFLHKDTVRKLLCKPKDWLATEDKNNIVYEIDCTNCKSVYFGEFKRSQCSNLNIAFRWAQRFCQELWLKKNEITKHCWEADHNFSLDQKEVVDRESKLIPRKLYFYWGILIL